MCRCLSHCLHRDSLCAGRYTLIKLGADKRKRVYSTACRISPGNGKDVFLPNLGNVWPWNVQYVLIQHEVSKRALNAPTAIEESKMMMPRTPCLSVQYFNCSVLGDMMTTLQEMGEEPLTPDSLVLIMLRSVEGWDHVAALVALTMRHKIELACERQRRPVAATIQYRTSSSTYMELNGRM